MRAHYEVILAVVKGATRLLDGVSQGAGSLARSVRSGALAETLGPGRRGKAGFRLPYSLWLAQPYAKVLLDSCLWPQLHCGSVGACNNCSPGEQGAWRCRLAHDAGLQSCGQLQLCLVGTSPSDNCP